MLKTIQAFFTSSVAAYHLGEGRVLKTPPLSQDLRSVAYHLGEGRVLKTQLEEQWALAAAYHLGEGRVLKTPRASISRWS